MANGAMASALFYALTAIIRCPVSGSDDLTMKNSLAEATTINFYENTSDFNKNSDPGDDFFPRTWINSEAKFPNGSFCRQVYACHYASTTEASSVVLGCSCHDYCSIYGDCCSDKVSVLPPSEPERLPRESYICAPRYLFQRSVYMITACPVSYNDWSISGNCSNFTDFGTPSMDIRWTPVTDVVTGTTFRNKYCAMCWGRTLRSMATWLWKLTCPETDQDSNKLQMESAATDYIRSACSLTFEPPVLNASLHFCKERVIADCGLVSNAAEALLSDCVSRPARYVYDEFGSVYWNAECARCRLWPGEPNLSCRPLGISRIGFGEPSLSLSIILTPESDDCAPAAGSLSSNDGWTPDSLCRSLIGCQSKVGDLASGCQSKAFSLCGDAAKALPGPTVGGSCISSASELIGLCTFMDSTPSSETVANAQSTAWLNSSTDGGMVLVVTMTDNTAQCYLCTTERYEKYTVVNRSLVVTFFSGLQSHSFDYPMYVVDDGVATVCTSVLPLQSESAPFIEGGCSAVPAFVSALFLCLSEVGLLVFLAAFCRAKALRRFPGEMVLNESIAFFLAFLLFLIRPLLGSVPAACTGVAVLIHYFLLAAFVWTALYSTEIARALSFRVTEGVSKYRRAVHYSIAWGAPLVCVAIGIGADARALQFRPGYGRPQCFIGNRLGNLTLFMAPLCIFLTVDIIVYCFMIVKLAIIARQTRSVRSSHHEKLWLSAKLLLSMGLLWIFAVLASFTQSQTLYCLFSLLNALQGVFVFVVFVCKRDVLVALRRKSKTTKTATTTATSALLSSRARSTA